MKINRKDKTEQQLMTPCYLVDMQKLNINFDCIYSAFRKEWGRNVKIGYSIKTNHLPFLLQYAKTQEFMAEAVSGDEYSHAISLGYEPQQIIYNGPQKDKKTLLEAINKGSIVNIDCLQEIQIIQENISFINIDQFKIGIRVNFDLENVCKGETTSGTQVSRFGICIENGDFDKAVKGLQGMGIPIRGLHMHYSTTTRSIAVFKALANVAADLITRYNLNDTLQFIDIGGGFWGGRVLANKPTMEQYSKVITSELNKVVSMDKTTLILEPGASILATAISYITKVLNIRDIRDTRIITIDGTLLHINPFMLNRKPEFTLKQKSRRIVSKQIICGNTCMENDRLICLNDGKELLEGDIITFLNAGAYTMAYNNCFINNPPKVYSKNNEEYNLVRGDCFDMMKLL